jgi:coenzyme A diphosphatase NUDT7
MIKIMFSFSSPKMEEITWTEQLIRQRLTPFNNTRYAWHHLPHRFPYLHRLRKAAVLVPLEIRDNELYVWLTVRSDNLRHDKGHVAFPGGMRDDSDRDAVETCLRESYEEIGLQPNQVTVITEHAPQINTRKNLITPIVGLISSDFEPEVNEDEVSKCFSLSLRRFLSREGYDYALVPFMDHNTRVVFFTDDVGGKEIVSWGLTAGICVEVAVALFQQMPQFDFEPVSLERPFGVQLHVLEGLEASDKSVLNQSRL